MTVVGACGIVFAIFTNCSGTVEFIVRSRYDSKKISFDYINFVFTFQRNIKHSHFQYLN